VPRIIEVRVPDMGNFSDVAVIDVLVKPGDSVEPETPLVTLETEKATMDVPSTASGIVDQVAVKKGGKVNAGDVVITVKSDAAEGAGEADKPGSQAAPSSSASASTASASAAPTSATPASGAANGAAVSAEDTSTGASRQARPGGAAATAAQPGSAQQASSVAAKAGPVVAGQASSSKANGLPLIDEPGFSRAYASPSVRKFARELGVDLASVTGTGFKNRITHDDVKGFVKKLLSGGAPATARGPAAPGAGTGLPKVPVVDFSQFGPVETKPLSRIQKISGARLHASWVNLPHVTQFDEADITELEDARGKLKQKALKEGIKLTPLAFVMRACVKALQEFPQFNASLDATGENLVYKKYLHLGFAADTPNGLLVPVVHDADRKDIYELARTLGELSEKAREGKLSAAQMQGGCFTISSLGGIGGTAFTPIINAPEVAILGVSKSTMKPVYQDGTFVPRLMLPLSLSYDHRVIDGALAVRFTTYLTQVLADPRGLLEAVP
jgi:pyruvate dehydrogenase E2 component (dihydrolipoamide acetyltransferase)